MSGVRLGSTSPDGSRAPRALRLNHVSIPAGNLDVSEEFYSSVFGMQRIAAPNFGFPVRWLRLGDAQLHLQVVPNETEPRRRTYQHVAFDVDDFESVYRTLEARGRFDDDAGTRYSYVWVLPGGEVQAWCRDPYGNLIEIDWPDVATLTPSVFGDRLRVLEDEEPQDEWHRRASLFLGPADETSGE